MDTDLRHKPLNGCGPLFPEVVSDAKSYRRQVFEAVRASGTIARVDLARQIGISPATVTQISTDLIDAGLIQESVLPRREGDSPRGRPPVGLEVQSRAAVVVGIKISDRSNSAVVLNMAGNMLGSATLPVPPTARSTEEILSEAETIISAAARKCRRRHPAPPHHRARPAGHGRFLHRTRIVVPFYGRYRRAAAPSITKPAAPARAHRQ